jgi:polyamine oxidase
VNPPISRRTFALGALAAVAAACSNSESETPAASDSSDAPDESVAPDASTAPSVPVAVRTRWVDDPYAHGSYSFLPPGATSDHRLDLAAPVDHRLFFAGEATEVQFPATVHGALLSGRRAAAEVIEQADDGAPVLVIGAGAAGLACARDLADAGLSVVVVDARDRIGGRVHTSTDTGVPLDLGASWIHGIEGNPVAELADAAGIDTVVTDWDDIVVLDADGNDIGDAYDAVAEVLEEALAAIDEEEPEGSLYDALAGTLDELDDDQRALAALQLHVEISGDVGADTTELSAAEWDTDEALPGDDAMIVGGYGPLIATLAGGLDVRLGQVVRTVTLDDTDDQVVVVVDGAEPFEADHVVITVPLGVLKAGSIAFEPPLGEAKTAAIEALGVSRFEKLWLQFDAMPITSGTRFVVRAPGDGQPLRWTDWADVSDLMGRPTLVAWNGGGAARDLDALTDDDVLAEALSALDGMFGA